MTLQLDKLADLRVKHLEMVQGAVARMAGQCASLKNYCVTLTTAVAGFGITLQRPAVVLLALVPVLIFALLDAQYLRLERCFRERFEEVRKGDWAAMPDFQIVAGSTTQHSYAAALTSWSILYFYGPLAFAVIAAVAIAGHVYGRFI